MDNVFDSVREQSLGVEVSGTQDNSNGVLEQEVCTQSDDDFVNRTVRRTQENDDHSVEDCMTQVEQDLTKNSPFVAANTLMRSPKGGHGR